MAQRALLVDSAQNAPWVRTCVGCRKRVPASELLRVAVVGDGVGGAEHGQVKLVPDPARRMPGRGAHLHPDSACLALAQRRRAFGRALRISGVPDAGAVVEFLYRAVEARASGEGLDTTDGDVETSPESKVGRPT